DFGYSVNLAVACGLIVAVGAAGAYVNLRIARSIQHKAELSALRSGAAHRAGMIQNALVVQSEQLNPHSLGENIWLRQYWQDKQSSRHGALYAAIVDLSGKVIFHTDSQFVGEQVSRSWYDRVLEPDEHI